MIEVLLLNDGLCKKSNDLIKEFHNITSPFNEKILENTKQIKTLENMRDTLLPKLMSGEVRVKVAGEDNAK